MMFSLVFFALLQSPPVVLADGPPREVIVVVGDVAWRVRTLEIRGPAPSPEPAPNPTPAPVSALATLAKECGAVLTPDVRAKSAAVFESIASQAAAGVFSDIPALNTEHRRAMVEALGEADAAKFRAASASSSPRLLSRMRRSRRWATWPCDGERSPRGCGSRE
jgi:hypothetical protein